MAPRTSFNSIRLRGMDQNTSMEDLRRIIRQLIDRLTNYGSRLPLNRATETGGAEHEKVGHRLLLQPNCPQADNL